MCSPLPGVWVPLEARTSFDATPCKGIFSDDNATRFAAAPGCAQWCTSKRVSTDGDCIVRGWQSKAARAPWGESLCVPLSHLQNWHPGHILALSCIVSKWMQIYICVANPLTLTEDGLKERRGSHF